tara:strand:+ start:113 stop:736 length:624 start_codon:yes stop_codon:yes gene_type:complete
MIINHKYKFVFLHIPKTAGTSITKALSPFCNKWDTILGCDCGPEEIVKDDGFKIHKHSNAQDIKTYMTSERWTNYFKFTFVRNPVDRAVSLYEWWKRTDAKWDPETKDAISKMSFKEFVFSRYCSPCQSDFLVGSIEKPPKIDFIGKFENLNIDFAYLCGLLDLPRITLERKNSSPREHSDTKDYLDEDITKEIKSKFHRDYTYFNY